MRVNKVIPVYRAGDRKPYKIIRKNRKERALEERLTDELTKPLNEEEKRGVDVEA